MMPIEVNYGLTNIGVTVKTFQTPRLISSSYPPSIKWELGSILVNLLQNIAYDTTFTPR